MFNNSEKKLAKQVNELDKTAFLVAYDKYSKDIYRYVYYRVSSKEITEDIVSQVFFNSWKYLAEGGKIDNVRAFFYRTAHNLLVNHYKGKERAPVAIDEEIERTLGKNSQIEIELDDQFNVELVKNCLEDLKPEYRELVRWRFVDDLSIEEIAKLSGKSKNTVYVGIHRAIRHLQQVVNNYSYEEKRT